VEKRNEGRGDGPQGLPAPKKVRQLQITLYRKAQSSPGYRFWSLYGEVQRADVLETAWRRVKANGGVAGVDRVEIADIAADPEKEAAWLKALREELRAKTYRPAEEAEGTREAAGRASRQCCGRRSPSRVAGCASWASRR
jgi:hypothetical protein